jgi:hypothetical protein
VTTTYTIKQAAIEATPASAVIATSAHQIPVDDWMKWTAWAFLVLQILYMLWRWRRDVRRDRERQAEDTE